VHPLQFGFVRRKVRTQRRYGMRRENPLVFYPRRAVEIGRMALRWYRLMKRYRAIMERVIADPAAAQYTDLALQPLSEAEQQHDFVHMTFADKIPKTHGAPERKPAAA